MNKQNLTFFLSEPKSFKVSKVGNLSRGWPESSLFDSYYTEVWERVLLLYLDCSNLPLICILCSVLSKAASNTIFESLVWLDLGLNIGLPDHWWILYSLGQRKSENSHFWFIGFLQYLRSMFMRHLCFTSIFRIIILYIDRKRPIWHLPNRPLTSFLGVFRRIVLFSYM